MNRNKLYVIASLLILPTYVHSMVKMNATTAINRQADTYTSYENGLPLASNEVLQKRFEKLGLKDFFDDCKANLPDHLRRCMNAYWAIQNIHGSWYRYINEMYSGHYESDKVRLAYSIIVRAFFQESPEILAELENKGEVMSLAGIKKSYGLLYGLQWVSPEELEATPTKDERENQRVTIIYYSAMPDTRGMRYPNGLPIPTDGVLRERFKKLGLETFYTNCSKELLGRLIQSKYASLALKDIFAAWYRFVVFVSGAPFDQKMQLHYHIIARAFLQESSEILKELEGSKELRTLTQIQESYFKFYNRRWVSP